LKALVCRSLRNPHRGPHILPRAARTARIEIARNPATQALTVP
jgi:hypothetical protein